MDGRILFRLLSLRPIPTLAFSPIDGTVKHDRLIKDGCRFVPDPVIGDVETGQGRKSESASEKLGNDNEHVEGKIRYHL